MSKQVKTAIMECVFLICLLPAGYMLSILIWELFKWTSK